MYCDRPHTTQVLDGSTRVLGRSALTRRTFAEFENELTRLLQQRERAREQAREEESMIEEVASESDQGSLDDWDDDEAAFAVSQSAREALEDYC